MCVGGGDCLITPLFHAQFIPMRLDTSIELLRITLALLSYFSSQ